MAGARVELGDVFGCAGNVIYCDSEFSCDIGEAMAGEVINVVIDDSVFEGLCFVLAFELEEEAFAEVFGADAWGLEALDEAFEALKPREWNAGDDTELGNWGVEEAIVVDVSDEELSYFALFGIEVGGAELLHKVFLECDSLDERIHHELVALACFGSARGVLLPFHALLFAPVVVKSCEGGELVVEIILFSVFVEPLLFEGDFIGLHFEYGVLIELLLDEGAEFKGRCLKYLQALLHLRREPHLLREGLVEASFCHENY